LLCAEVREPLSLGYRLPRRDLERGRRLGSRSSGVGGLAGGGGAGALGPSLARIAAQDLNARRQRMAIGGEQVFAIIDREAQ
jgi:hypothetical protein